jgi:hypothetical protein
LLIITLASMVGYIKVNKASQYLTLNVGLSSGLVLRRSEARGGDIRMPEPLLHLGDVGLMVERVGGRRGAQ